MLYKDLSRMGDITLPIILVTERSSREAFMKACREAKLNVFKTLKERITDDSLRLHVDFPRICGEIAVRLQRTMEKLFQLPHNIFNREDLKMIVAWGVHNAYVKCYASKDNKVVSRDWNDDLEKSMSETIREIVYDMYRMYMANQF